MALGDVLLGKLAELAGKAVAAGVDYVGRKLGASAKPEPPHPSFADVEHQRRQQETAVAHKVAPKK